MTTTTKTTTSTSYVAQYGTDGKYVKSLTYLGPDKDGRTLYRIEYVDVLAKAKKFRSIKAAEQFLTWTQTDYRKLKLHPVTTTRTVEVAEDPTKKHQLSGETWYYENLSGNDEYRSLCNLHLVALANTDMKWSIAPMSIRRSYSQMYEVAVKLNKELRSATKAAGLKRNSYRYEMATWTTSVMDRMLLDESCESFVLQVKLARDDVTIDELNLEAIAAKKLQMRTDVRDNLAKRGLDVSAIDVTQEV